MRKSNAAVAFVVAIIITVVAPALAAPTLILRTLAAGAEKNAEAVADGKATDAKLLDFVPPQRQLTDRDVTAWETAIIEVDVSKAGRLTKCSLIKTSGDPSLDRRTLRALRSAKYEPATLGGQPVAGVYALNIGFDVDE